ncbi:MAG: Rieske (2Fe-2S) protein [Pseudonocardiaceae bacterium]
MMDDHEQITQGQPGQPGQGSALTRRAVVAGTGMLATAAALAGCSSYGNEPAQPNVTGAAPAAPPGAPPPASAGAPLTSTRDVPVGSGQVFPAQTVVVTQPDKGTFEAFSAICTHQGCTVKDVRGGTINCACHGSKFNIRDGSVVNGPAKKPLAPRKIVVEGEQIRLA